MLLRQHQGDREGEISAGFSNALVIDNLIECWGKLMRTKAKVR